MFYNAWDPPQPTPALDDLPWNDTISDFLKYDKQLHEWCRDRISDDEESQLSYRRALTLMAKSVKWKSTSEDYTLPRSLVSHVHEFLRLRGRLNDVSEEDKMQQWPTLALILAENGWTTDALPLIEAVLALQKSKLGADHPDTLRSMGNLAIRYSEAGRREEALKLTEEVLAHTSPADPAHI
ncbi:hypothetical protein LTR96_011488 [Exophiala xenobiotica]|nr:hypothetical protein LTR41_011876 [Exophiala xenobiotica]KAK5263082.1 hypothetical protein LTR96_011488 [Exophiala xenobiotica]KAK5332363.1 hypothetical protein LTR98_011508 [Exophiala xenobiotica]KAK5550254.1 hypothetical protein LTR46_011740 [Exophiala xenobiotica]